LLEIKIVNQKIIDMKAIYTLGLISAILLLVSKSTLKAQTLESFGIGEWESYVSEYMNPFAQAMSVSMSGGWANTAKVHSTLGFDITFSGTYSIVPTENYTFSTGDLNMPQYTFSESSTPSVSAGSDINPPNMTRIFGGQSLEFPAFKGLGVNFGGMMTLQGAVGLPKGIELMFRYVPDFSGTVNKVLPSGIAMEPTGMWGVGVKHDIKQWIPVVKSVPFLNMSVLFAYSKFHTGFSGSTLRIDPERLNVVDNINNDALWNDQKFDMEMSSFVGSFLVSVNIPVFQPYIGIGFNSGHFKGGFCGNYPIVDAVADPNDPFEANTYEQDPLKVDTKNTDFNFQAGARLKMGFFVIYYQYTRQGYNMHTGGIGITLR